jgi:hypothetical protein
VRASQGIGNTSITWHLKFMAFSAKRRPCAQDSDFRSPLHAELPQVDLLIYLFICVLCKGTVGYLGCIVYTLR